MSKTVKIAINGFGRIGRNFLRQLLHAGSTRDFEVVAINDLGRPEVLAHLFEFDSIHGLFKGDVSYDTNHIIVGAKAIPILRQSELQKINWAQFDIDVLLESTGQFKSSDSLMCHITAGAPRVLVSSVTFEHTIKTIVLGANQQLLDGSEQIISNASCTTNCAAPLIDIIDRHFGIESGYITTVHSYTSDQSLHDRPHSDLRRARAAALSIIPTTTGAAKAITRIFPHLEGRLGGAGIRVPVPNGSLTDITYIVKKQAEVEQVNQIFSKAAKAGPWYQKLEYTEKPIVSIDVVGNPHSCVFDAKLTSVIGNMVKVVGWYDNEIGYSNRLLDLIQYWSKLWE